MGDKNSKNSRSKPSYRTFSNINYPSTIKNPTSAHKEQQQRDKYKPCLPTIKE